MNQCASLAEPCCTPPPSTATRRFLTGGVWHDMTWAPDCRRPVRIMYRMEGPAGAPVIATFGGISANRRVDEWWQSHYGPDHALDPNCHRILSIDWLGERWPDGSPVTTAQQAAALVAVMDELAIERLEACIGASYGAMVGLALAAAFPDRIGQLIAISGAQRPHPMAAARRLIQREIIRLGLDAGDERRGLRLARALAMTTYRPPSLFDQRFGHDDPQRVLGRLDSYFDRQARGLIGRFDAERYLCLSESLDLHRVEPADVTCPVTLVAVRSDELVPVEQLQSLDRALPNSSLRVINSDYGHDAFLKEPVFFDKLIREALAEGVAQ
jgi:homoserine O-acetyltransferase/O-succinyltransferase